MKLPFAIWFFLVTFFCTSMCCEQTEEKMCCIQTLFHWQNLQLQPKPHPLLGWFPTFFPFTSFGHHKILGGSGEANRFLKPCQHAAAIPAHLEGVRDQVSYVEVTLTNRSLLSLVSEETAIVAKWYMQVFGYLFFLFRERLFSLEGRKNLKAVSLYGFCSPSVYSLDLRKWSWRYTSLSALPKTCGTSGQEVVLCIHMEAVKSRPNE